MSIETQACVECGSQTNSAQQPCNLCEADKGLFSPQNVVVQTPKKTCADLLEYLWQHGYLDRDTAQHFDKTWGDGTVGKRPWRK